MDLPQEFTRRLVEYSYSHSKADFVPAMLHLPFPPLQVTYCYIEGKYTDQCHHLDVRFAYLHVLQRYRPMLLVQKEQKPTNTFVAGHTFFKTTDAQ
ncbi:hypothetical protein KCU65_g37, partial [Aureobasidium melanogenum]